MTRTMTIALCAILAFGTATADEGGMDDKVGKFFGKFDSDKDGKVTKQEFPHDRLFDRLDTNKDGVITKDDFGAYKGDAPKPKPTDTTGTPAGGGDLMKLLDVNKDGKLTLDEMGGNAKLFHSLDRDANQVVDAAEAAKATPEQVAMVRKSSTGGEMGGGEMGGGTTPGPKKGGSVDPTQRRPQRGQQGRGGNRMAMMVKRFDTDGDGTISAQEWVAGQKKTFARLDANGDGKLDAKELEALGGGQRGGRGQGQPGRGGDPAAMAQQFFKRMDKNGDGAVTVDEVNERMKPRFAQMDSDGDGKLTLDEFSAAVRKRFEQMRKRGREGKQRKPKKAPDAPAPGDGDGEEGSGTKQAQSPPAGGNPMVDRLFARLDGNGDGKVTKDEWRGPAERFTALDKNGDGAVTKDEIAAAGRRRKQQK